MEEELLKALQTAISYLQMGKKDQSIIDELLEQQKLIDDGFLRHCIKSIEWNRDKLKEQNDE